jgi:GAF domain-containing protein
MEPIPETTEAVEEFGPFDDADLLQQLRDRADEVLEFVPDCVGLSLASREHDVTWTMVASTEEVAVLDAVQYLGDGPCVRAVDVGEVVEYHEGDPLDEEAWRHFAMATAAASVSSTLTLPVLSGQEVVGSVNLYARSPHAFDGRHEEVARIFGAWAPGAVTNADLSFSTRQTAERAPAKLREDLDVEVAVGLLAAAHTIDADAARVRLVEAARRAGVTEAVLAASIIEIERDAAGTDAPPGPCGLSVRGPGPPSGSRPACPGRCGTSRGPGRGAPGGWRATRAPGRRRAATRSRAAPRSTA